MRSRQVDGMNTNIDVEIEKEKDKGSAVRDPAIHSFSLSGKIKRQNEKTNWLLFALCSSISF